MRLRFIQLLAVAASVALTGSALANGYRPAQKAPRVVPVTQQAENSAEQEDRALMYRLIRQVRRIDRDTDKLMEQAMTEARENNGQANPETKAKLLSLRDERDRLFSRMLILSMRHGWEIPDLDRPTVKKSTRAEAEQSVFGAVDALVKARFTEEASKIAGMIRLPVVSLESQSG